MKKPKTTSDGFGDLGDPVSHIRLFHCQQTATVTADNFKLREYD